MTILIPLLVSLLGLLLYAFTSSKASEVGRLMFACGLLVSLLSWGSHAVHLLR